MVVKEKSEDVLVYIPVKHETKETLRKYKENVTWDDLIVALIDEAEKNEN